MRAVIAITSAVSMILAQVPTTGFAQSVQPVALNSAQTAAQNAAIDNAFKAFPNGGDALAKRISDLITRNPKLATDLVKYVQTTPSITYGQKIAAERGLAAALERMGVKAADLPVYKAPPPQAAVYDYTWLAALAALAVVGGIVCVAGACNNGHGPPISPNF